jgi:hypothetical protein
MMRRLLGAIAALTCAGIFAAPAAAGGPTVVELFTSQSCYSCPPAEAFLGEIAQRADVIALEFHVDYWDDLVYGAAGRWKDRYSAPAFTERQRSYNLTIRNKSAVYTPQMVVDGRNEAVGSDRGAVNAAISRAAASRGTPVEVDVALRDNACAVAIAGGPREPAAVWLVRYLRAETTRVEAGENKGKTLKNHNVVTDLRKIGEWRGERIAIQVPDLALGANEGCAVIVQAERTGPVLGAGMCKNQGS